MTETIAKQPHKSMPAPAAGAAKGATHTP